jgi:hypothetical protein
MFNDEAPFQLPGHVTDIVGSNNPHAVAQETAREGPKIKVIYILSKEISSGPSSCRSQCDWYGTHNGSPYIQAKQATAYSAT